MRYAGQFAAAALIALCAASPGARAQTSDTDETGAYAQRLRELLRDQGYSQIDFLDLKGERITANACSGENAYRVEVSRGGRVIKRSETGDCDPKATGDPVSAEVLIDALYGQGYLRLDIVDSTPPTLMVNACRGGRQYQVRLNADGNIIDSKDTGTCDLSEGEPLEPKEIERILSLQGYRSIRMPTDEAESYKVTACSGVREFQLTVSEVAQITERKAVGFCEGNGRNVEYLPPRPVEDSLLNASNPLPAESCQNITDYLQFQRPITFVTDSADLSDKDLEQIGQIAAALKRCGTTRVLVEGHTSTTGSDEMNQELSERRALAVQQALLDQGVPSDRMTARGFGEAYPRIAGNIDANLNRRIEINLEWSASPS